VDDAEEVLPKIKAVAAEHGSVSYVLQGGHMVEYEIPIKVFFPLCRHD
jgi:hypothetical protein